MSYWMDNPRFAEKRFSAVDDLYVVYRRFDSIWRAYLSLTFYQQHQLEADLELERLLQQLAARLLLSLLVRAGCGSCMYISKQAFGNVLWS